MPNNCSITHIYKVAAWAALSRFGVKTAASDEVRLKIRPFRGFHGMDGTLRNVSEKGAGKSAEHGLAPLEPQADDHLPAEALAAFLQSLPQPPGTIDPSAKKDPLDRSTSWGPATHPAAGNSGDVLGNPAGGASNGAVF